MASAFPSPVRINMNPPPPRFPASGHVTARARATATAASTALPPRFMTSTPTREAMASTVATMPCFARAGSRDAACSGSATRRSSAASFFMWRETYQYFHIGTTCCSNANGFAPSCRTNTRTHPTRGEPGTCMRVTFCGRSG